MSGLKHAESFQDLIAYQKARELQRDIFLVSQAFPKEERYSLSDQIRRSSRSIGANIAEAWARRRYEAHFISKLADANGEQYETQHWIETAGECGYLDPETSSALLQQCQEAGRLIGGMIEKASLFCGPPVQRLREETEVYFTSEGSGEVNSE